MKLRQLVALFILLAGASLFFSGCETKQPEDSQIPWSQPADWEGQVPGMGQPR